MRFACSVFIVLLMQTPAFAEPLQASAEFIERPSWVGLQATTNENMIGYVHKGKRPYKIPVKGAQMTMYRELTQYWKKAKHLDVTIDCQPVQGHPGNFRFSSVLTYLGPRGWIEDLGYKTEQGWAYRYWFDE